MHYWILIKKQISHLAAPLDKYVYIPFNSDYCCRTDVLIEGNPTSALSRDYLD
jgi:hypothetical protein